MKSQTIQFKSMNSDIADKFLPEGVYKSAVNCRPNNINEKGGFVVSNIKSNKAIESLFFGQTVKYIGGCSDDKRNAIISFYEGVNTNYITGYDTKTETEYFILQVTKVLVPFGGRIINPSVLDDYLFWLADGKAMKLNIVEAATDTTLDRYSFTDLLIDKFPPLYPPTCVAVENNSFIGNNILNNIFQFAYAYEYEDGEISSYSPFSKSVLPESTNDLDIDFLNNEIDVTVQTGTSRVVKIWVAYKKGQNRDWALAEKLDKSKLSIPNNSTHVYQFYNDKYISGLNQADVVAITNNPFYEFGAQAISRDNFVVYGLVKDGLEKPTNVSLSLTYSLLPSPTRVASYKVGAVHEFGVIFRDENGRTDGVNARAEISIPFYTDPAIRPDIVSYEGAGDIPYANISWTITGDAPLWAKTMSIVYLGNKTTASFVDYTLTKIQDVGVYTYMSLDGLNLLKQTPSVLDPRTPNSNLAPYTFTKGDRIRFRTDKSGVVLDATSNKYDYEILGYVAEVVDSAGNVLYPETIYTDAFDWSAANIGKNSVFEIYSPKKEFADDIFYEIGDVSATTEGTIHTTTGTLTQGDVYAFNREMTNSDLGELRAQEDRRYDFQNAYGVSIQLNVLKPATGVRPVSGGRSNNYKSLAFYENVNSTPMTVIISGKYDYNIETDDGAELTLESYASGGGTLVKEVLDTVPNTSGGVRFKRVGSFTRTRNIPVGGYILLYVRNYHNVIMEPPMYFDLSVKAYETATGASITKFVESKDYSDYFTSDEHSIGRPYVEIPDEDTSMKNNIVYTGKYFANTDIDETNKINPLNVKYVPYSFGLISNMIVRGDTLKVFTKNKEMSFYLGKESYQNPDGTGAFVFSSTPIGNIRVYDSDYGVSHPESMLQTNTGVYYYDRKNASVVASYDNGQRDLSEFGMKTYLREVTARINASTTNNVFIGFNDKNKELFICFVIDGVQETLVFNEKDNVFTHFLENEYVNEDASKAAPQGMMHYGENLLVYVKGIAYLQEGGVGYNNFFGSYKRSTITFVVNQEPISTKILQSLNYQSTGQFTFDIETEPRENYPFGMHTVISKGRQRNFEGVFSSDIPRNTRTKSGATNLLGYATGDPLRSRVATITMENDDTTRFDLDAVTVNFINSPVI